MFRKAVFTGAMVLSSIGAEAASGSLTVTGTITPEACTVVLGGGGAADYGTLTAATVKGYTVWNSTHYALPEKIVSVNVNCSSPTAFALVLTDHKASSKATSLADANLKYGLGMSGSSQIGFYDLKLSNVRVKATLVDTLTAVTGMLARAKGAGTGSWGVPSSTLAQSGYVDQTLAIGFYTGSTKTSPAAFTNLTSSLSITPKVSKPLVDGATASISLDGSGTVGLEYI